MVRLEVYGPLSRREIAIGLSEIDVAGPRASKGPETRFARRAAVKNISMKWAFDFVRQPLLDLVGAFLLAG